jgi:creatinine amidohydrolase
MKTNIDCFWIRNTDRTLPRLCRASGRVAVLPLTSIESHGPHLPLGSDPLTFEYILKKVAQRETVAILPILPYSYVADARMLPGAVHIRTDILQNLVENICDEVSRNGFDKIVLLQGHGGNVTLDEGFMRRQLEREKPYFLYSLPVVAGQGDAIYRIMETQELGHACEFETSLNLVACPELVNLKVLKGRTFPTQKKLDIGPVRSPLGWVVEHPDMAVGTPQKATREKGEKAAEIWAQAMVDQLRLIKRDRRGPAVWAQYWKRVNGVRFQKER